MALKFCITAGNGIGTACKSHGCSVIVTGLGLQIIFRESASFALAKPSSNDAWVASWIRSKL